MELNSDKLVFAWPYTFFFLGEDGYIERILK